MQDWVRNLLIASIFVGSGFSIIIGIVTYFRVNRMRKDTMIGAKDFYQEKSKVKEITKSVPNIDEKFLKFTLNTIQINLYTSWRFYEYENLILQEILNKNSSAIMETNGKVDFVITHYKEGDSLEKIDNAFSSVFEKGMLFILGASIKKNKELVKFIETKGWRFEENKVDNGVIFIAK